jgi:hypothetical protein
VTADENMSIVGGRGGGRLEKVTTIIGLIREHIFTHSLNVLYRL